MYVSASPDFVSATSPDFVDYRVGLYSECHATSPDFVNFELGLYIAWGGVWAPPKATRTKFGKK